jgi:hypothetical protein
LNAQLSTKANSRRGAAARPAERWRIDGGFYTYADIAQRLGVSIDTARLRMQKLRGADGAITFARLEAFGK